MKVLFRNLLLGSSLALAVFGCRPDQVEPKGVGQETLPSVQSNAVHPVLTPICTGIEVGRLVHTSGSFQIDNCGFLPCGPDAPEWGNVEIMDGLDEYGEHVMAVNINLAFGWFVERCQYRLAPVNSVPLDNNGFPELLGEWETREVQPMLNAWQMRTPVGDWDGCFDLAIKLDVVKMDFFGGVTPGTERELWLYNDSTGGNALVRTWCPNKCGDGADYECEASPSVPEVVCTDSRANNININQSADVVCVSQNGNVQNVNFNQAGTLVIPAGTTVSGGINANNGGTLIVEGEFDWNQNANINGNFKIYIGENGKLIRRNDLTMNNQNNLLVNLGVLEIGQNLTYSGKVYNSGVVDARGLNVNSNSWFINSGVATFENFANFNNGTVNENCGTLDVGRNLEINGGASFVNGCTVVAEGYSHQNGTFENYGIYIAGLSGWGDGFSNQGQSLLHDGSVIVTKNFFWSTNQPIELDGAATVLVAESQLNGDNEVTQLSGRGQLRMSQGCRLTGEGSLTVADIDPLSQGDNPTGSHLSFPQGLKQMVIAGNGTDVVFRQLDGANDLPAGCGR